MANILVMASAHSNSVFVAAADRVGVERRQPFVGQSLIASYTGWPIGGPASPDREETIYAEANLADARRKRNRNEYNQVLRDRRSDVYDEMLGARVSPGWYSRVLTDCASSGPAKTMGRTWIGESAACRQGPQADVITGTTSKERETMKT